MVVRFVSSNPAKFREVRAGLREHGIRVVWTRRALPELQADRLEDVVRGKLAALRPSSHPVLVEDSGLFLEGLDGFPGVYSAYAYRTIGLGGILRLLRGRSRRAVFRTVAGVAAGDQRWLTRGESRGTIAPRPRGNGGFGYDPIFIPTGFRTTFAEMTLREKNALSHRGQAIGAVGARLKREALGRPGRSKPMQM
ncbi:MAG TPA: non-canonical purine NTP pyrophosphatase [Thermoplasmata archaeon]